MSAPSATHDHHHPHAHHGHHPGSSTESTTPFQDLSIFDNAADVWDGKAFIQQINRLFASYLLDNNLVPPHASMFDFGCGTGTLSELLYDHVETIYGLDASKGMINVFQGKLDQIGHKMFQGDVKGESEGKTKDKIVLDSFFLTPETVGKVRGQDCDFVTATETIHHIPNVSEVLSLLAKSLKEEGKVYLVEFYAGEKGERFHSRKIVDNCVFYHGFKKGQLSELMTAAGLTDVQEISLGSLPKECEGDHSEEEKQTIDYEIFLAVGTKPKTK